MDLLFVPEKVEKYVQASLTNNSNKINWTTNDRLQCTHKQAWHNVDGTVSTIAVSDSDNVISTKRSQGHFLHDKLMRRSGEHNRLCLKL